MAQDPLVFSTNLSASQGRTGRWVSDALKLPGAKLVKVSDPAGVALPGFDLSDGAVITSGYQPEGCVAVLEVPSDLVPHSAIEQAKIALEREKLVLEDANRKRTWAWSIGSAVLAAAVTITVAWMNRPDPTSRSPPSSSKVAGPTTDAIEACRTSLRRLPLLAMSNGQTVAALSEAISRHENECNEVLVKMLAVR